MLSGLPNYSIIPFSRIRTEIFQYRTQVIFGYNTGLAIKPFPARDSFLESLKPLLLKRRGVRAHRMRNQSEFRYCEEVLTYRDMIIPAKGHLAGCLICCHHDWLHFFCTWDFSSLGTQPFMIRMLEVVCSMLSCSCMRLLTVVLPARTI